MDAIIVTVSPTFVGHEGVGYGDNLLASQVRHRVASFIHPLTLV